MTYGSASGVAANVPNLVGEEGTFTKTTIPTDTQVERWLAAGYALINGDLAGRGYSTPVPATATVYSLVVDLEELYAAARAESARMSARIGPDERTRGQMLMQQFKDGLKALLAMDLSRAGLTHTGKLYAGGISQSDKDSYNADTDRVQPRFKRGMWRMPDTTRPGGDDDGEDE